MAQWIKTPAGNLLLRLAGVVLLASVWYDYGQLRTLTLLDPADLTAGQFILGAMLFLGGSMGSALLLLGRHVGDQVILSDRWTRRQDF